MSELLFRSQRFLAGGPGLICVRSAGFLVHGDAPGRTGSYRPSAGVSALRPTGGEVAQVYRGVDVTVDDDAAFGADIRPLGQGSLVLTAPQAEQVFELG